MPNTTTPNPALSADSVPAEWLRRLWERMTASYGHAWTSANGLQPQKPDGSLTIVGQTWALVLADLDGGQIAHGLRACVISGREFPPKPGQFRLMCLGDPSEADVLAELNATDTRRSAFARLVWQRIDSYAWRHASPDRREAMVRTAYTWATEYRARGGPLPPEPDGELGHDAPERGPITDEVGEAEIERIAALLAGKDCEAAP